MKVAALPVQRARLAKQVGISTEQSIYDHADANQFLYCENIRRALAGDGLVEAGNACGDRVPFWKQQFQDASDPSKQRKEKCPQCKSTDTALLRSAQLRSADEGHTLTFECQVCKTRWNVNT